MRTEQDPKRLLRSFVDISLQIAEGLDVVKVLDSIVERAMAVTGAHYGLAVTLAAEGQIERLVERGDAATLDDQVPPTTGLIGHVIKRRSPTRLKRISDHPSPVEAPFNELPLDAFIGLPMQHRGEVVGGVYLTKPPEAGVFDPEDQDLLEAMVAIAAVAVDNSLLFAAESSRAERAALLRHVASKVRRSLDLQDVLNVTVETLGRAARVDRCLIALASDEGPELDEIGAQWTGPDVEPLSGEDLRFPIAVLAAKTRTTQWTDDLQRSAAWRARSGQVADMRAVLSAPLDWGDQLLGVVTFQTIEPREWTPSDRALAEAAAREVSVAIHHARLYEEAVSTSERLRELDELRSDFISMVSHELRSPMTVVASIADILAKRRHKLTDERQNELIASLGREARRLTRLVSEVLDLEAIDQGRMELHVSQVDLSALGAEAIADAGEAERTKLVVEPGNAVVSGDYDKIKQVLLNLISNAAKFSGDGSPITVSVTPKGDEGVLVSVSDQGPGIPDEYKSRLFQRFSRVQATGARKPGSGLGLYLARIIIEGHSGEIWCDSIEGQGATFTFRLPR